MPGGPSPPPHPSRGPRRPTHWHTRRTSALCPKLGSRWNNSWMVAQPVRVVQGLCNMWRGPLIPGYKTLCPLTWMSGGHSSSWPESPTVPSGCPETNAAMVDPLPEEDHGALSTLWPGWAPATPEVPAFGLLHLLFPWLSYPKLPGPGAKPV
uniref:MAPK regulated corepressor interacting protein 2 isoform X3 n=1 Tax=Castor canadensis TaxID=51338 RepID=A0A8B7VQV6_CASCN|nr:MAPK regulated corepressor interacting protein 2 isoform X3 [Castor canadensis]